MFAKAKKNDGFIKLLQFVLFLLFFALPFHRVSSTVPSILFIACSVLYIFKNKISIKTIKEHALFVQLFAVYFIVGFLSIFKDVAIQEFLAVEKLKIFFVLLPFLFFMLKDELLFLKNLILNAIVWGSFSAMILFLIIAFFQFPSLGFDAFLYSKLVAVSSINPIIYSMLLNSVVLFIYYTDVVKSVLMKHLLIWFYGLFIFLLLSKAGMFVFVLSYFLILYDSLKNRKLVFFGSLTGITLLAILFFITNKNQVIQVRFNVFKYHYENRNSEDVNKQFPRAVILDCSKEIVSNNFLFGVGVSNTRKALQKEFRKVNFTKGIEANYNAHNQFLETLLGSGFIGLLSLLSIFMYLFYEALQRRSLFLFHFTCIIVFYTFIESIFESQMSVFVFLLYVFMILILTSSTKKAHT